MFGFLPQPAHMPCGDCGASVRVVEREHHVCSEERRLDYRLFQLRGDLEVFEDELGTYLDSAPGRFELYYAERERRLRRAGRRARRPPSR